MSRKEPPLPPEALKARKLRERLAAIEARENDIIIPVPVSVGLLNTIDLCHKRYLRESGDNITRLEFIRQALQVCCAQKKKFRE